MKNNSDDGNTCFYIIDFVILVWLGICGTCVGLILLVKR
jgi:hypothetical protein